MRSANATPRHAADLPKALGKEGKRRLPLLIQGRTAQNIRMPHSAPSRSPGASPFGYPGLVDSSIPAQVPGRAAVAGCPSDGHQPPSGDAPIAASDALGDERLYRVGVVDSQRPRAGAAFAAALDHTPDRLMGGAAKGSGGTIAT